MKTFPIMPQNPILFWGKKTAYFTLQATALVSILFLTLISLWQLFNFFIASSVILLILKKILNISELRFGEMTFAL